jgi:hypothetical protein
MKGERTSPELTKEQNARLDALEAMPDSEIDYSDIPMNENFGRRGFRFKDRHKFIDKKGRLKQSA